MYAITKSLVGLSLVIIPAAAFSYGMGMGSGMGEGKKGMKHMQKKKMGTVSTQAVSSVPEKIKAFAPPFAALSAMKAYGFEKTGLVLVYPEAYDCPKMTSAFASPYRTDGSKRSKRFFKGLHGGIDIPQPKGTPLLAMADGELILKHEGQNGGIGGKGIWLRHSPEQSGTGKWIFIEYKHLDELPDLREGDLVKMGQIIGLTGNSGTTGGYYGSQGFYHLHMTAYWSHTQDYKFKKVLVPKDGEWLDPVAFLKGKPLDSKSLKELSDDERKVRVSFKTEQGQVIPENAKVIWPYACNAISN